MSGEHRVLDDPIGGAADPQRSVSFESDIIEVNAEAPTEPLSLPRLVLINTAACGVQFSQSCQFAYTTPLFRALGLGYVASSIVWLAAPMSGLIMQPLVGVWSDRCKSKFGRRRPFVLVGTITLTAGLILLGNARALGRAVFGDTMESVDDESGDGGKPSGTRGGAIALSVAGFWIMDLSINTVQGPFRSVLSDLLPAARQDVGNAVLSGALAVGTVAGYFTGSRDLSRLFPFLPGGQVTALFSIAIAVLLVTVAVTLVAARERPLGDVPREGRIARDAESRGEEGPSSSVSGGSIDSATAPLMHGSASGAGDDTVIVSDEAAPVGCLSASLSTFVKIFRAIVAMPPALRRLCAVQFFNWLAWFAYLQYATDWMAGVVYGGVADGTRDQVDLYDRGRNAGSLALTYMALVQLAWSVAIPATVRIIGTRVVFGVSTALLCGLFASLTLITDSKAATVALASFGIPWGTSMVLPFFILGASVDVPSDRGLYVGVLNIFIVVPQIISSLLGGWIVSATGKVTDAFVMGSVFAGVATGLVPFLLVGGAGKRHD